MSAGAAPTLRLLLTADWQIGLRAGQLRERAGDLRRERLRAARRTLEVARSSVCELVVVAGDLFDRPDVDADAVDGVVSLFAEFSDIPILVLPGNHDPVCEGDVWGRREWRSAPAHVHLLREAREIELSSLVGGEVAPAALYPCPIGQKQSRLDPTGWIPSRAEGDALLRLGIAHGSLDSMGKATNFPIAHRRAELAGLDFLALGDWHGTTILERAAYPGTPEQCSFGEQGAGSALVVTLRRGAPPQIEQHRVGRFHWVQEEVEVRSASDLQALRHVFDAGGSAPESTIARLRLELAGGDLQLIERSEGLLEQLREELFFLDAALEVLDLSEVEFESPLLAALDASLHALEQGEPVPDALDELRAAPLEVVREARLQLRRWMGAARGELEEAEA